MRKDGEREGRGHVQDMGCLAGRAGEGGSEWYGHPALCLEREPLNFKDWKTLSTVGEGELEPCHMSDRGKSYV